MKYQIAAAARLTGLSVDTIRSWERRYKLVEPGRDNAGKRLYSENDVARLRLAGAATRMGHPIRRVAQMTNQELEALTDRKAGETHSGHGVVAARVLAALHANDATHAEQILRSATLVLPVRSLVLDVMAPVLREVGELWEHGRITIWQEHLVSTIIRNTAGIIPRPGHAGSPLLFATPPFELHEFGIALAAILAASHGRRTYNLGTSVPFEEVVHACRRLKPAVAVIGMTQHSTPMDDALEYVVALDQRLPRGVEIWLGGTLGAQVAVRLQSARVRAMETLEEFEQECRRTSA